MDGVAIGIGFQVSPMVGLTVAIAVIAHDFSDGLNTVSLMLRHRNSTRRAITMLAIDALAPLVGVLLTLAFTIPPFQLMTYLGFFAGFLLYIGVSDILPEAHSRAGPGVAVKLIALTCCGAAFVYAVVRWSLKRRGQRGFSVAHATAAGTATRARPTDLERPAANVLGSPISRSAAMATEHPFRRLQARRRAC